MKSAITTPVKLLPLSVDTRCQKAVGEKAPSI
jgi:hypothetical protein